MRLRFVWVWAWVWVGGVRVGWCGRADHALGVGWGGVGVAGGGWVAGAGERTMRLGSGILGMGTPLSRLSFIGSAWC